MNNNVFEKQSTKKTFFKFALPSIVGFLIASIQIMIDGIFVGNYVGARGLAAVNLSMPYMNFIMSIALMIGLGGGVIASIYLGEKKNREANEVATFTLISIISIVAVVAGISIFFIDGIISILGASPALSPHVREYLLPFLMMSPLLNIFAFSENFIRAAGKPNAVFISGILSLIINILLDYLFIVKLGLGLKGASFATALAFSLANLLLFIYFFGGRSQIQLCRPKGSLRLLWNMVYNGSSEMFSIVSAAVATFLFNRIIMDSIGETGVSALTIVFYVNGIVNISLFGLAQALQPIVSYNLGARRFDRIEEVMKIALLTGAGIGILAFITMKVYNIPLIRVFTKGEHELTALASEAMNYFVFAYLFSFGNIVIASFHTAIEKPLESAGLAILRSLILVSIFLFTLPMIFGHRGIWMVIPLAEITALFISLFFMKNSMRGVKKRIMGPIHI